MSESKVEVNIGSMNMRGQWAPLPTGSTRINVTSSQSKQSRYRLNFSPMTEIKGGYKGYYCFENYWQSGKRYQNASEETEHKIESWWRSRTKGCRRCPMAKGQRVSHAQFPGKEPLGYIESRKQVYVPEYYNLIKDLPLIEELKRQVQEGVSYTICDFDGPREEDGTPTVKQVSVDLLREKINDPRHPFGHGYIIAGLLLGIDIKDYITDNYYENLEIDAWGIKPIRD